MAYSTKTQVQNEFKSVDFSTSSICTNAMVDEFIAEEDALIDAKIGRKYVVPITGATSLLIVRSLSRAMVADRVRKKIEVKTGEKDKNQGERKGEKKAAEKILDDIVSGKIILSDSTLLVSHDGIKSYTYDNDVNPEFDVEKDQW